uniref:Glycolipid transfer protein domain-containing protein n=1 Tax=Oryza punctata TaxID=4537 RepID=A0A0E0LXV8_ORYPU
MAEVQVEVEVGGERRRPLAEYAAELEALSLSVRAAPPLRLKPLVQACHHALAFFDLLGAAFWKTEYAERLVALERAAEAMDNAEELVDRDVATGRVRATGTHSNNLVRVKRGIELKRALFQLMLAQLQMQKQQRVVSFDGSWPPSTRPMQKYINAANGLISYIDELFASRGLTTDF